jgi:general secretion pathway protein M
VKNWFESLSGRERVMLILAVLSLAILLAWVGVWRPLGRSLASLEDQRDRLTADVAWMSAAAGEVTRLRTGPGSQPASRGGESLLALVERSARGGGLVDGFRRGEPAGDKRVRVWLENASFDASLGWLESIQTAYGVTVVDAVVERAGVPGLVNMRLLLAEP